MAPIRADFPINGQVFLISNISEGQRGRAVLGPQTSDIQT